MSFSETAYESNEIKIALAEEERINRAPLADRKAARAEFADSLATDPALVAERVGWLLNGTFGHGPFLRARQILNGGPRTNVRAGLVQLTAVYDWRCPRAFAVVAWKGLTDAQKVALDAAVDAELREIAAQDANDRDERIFDGLRRFFAAKDAK